VSWFVVPEGDTTIRCQVVVIGSGAGGAFAARTLAEAGVDTVLLEEGHRVTPAQFPEQLGAALVRVYQEGGMRTMEGAPPVPLPSGRGLGGSTLVNSAICFATPPETLARWNEESSGAFADEREFYAIQAEVEAALGVARTPDALLSGNDRAHRDAARALGWREENLRRNAPTCVGCGRCNSGCTVGGKASVDQVMLPRAAAAGCRVLAGCRVDRVATGRVEGRVFAADGAARGNIVVQADAVVLAAGAVSTPRLLLDSGVAAGGGPVGAGLRVHPVLSVHAMLPRPVFAPGATQGHGVTEFVDDDVLLEANPTLPGSWFQSLPLVGRPLQEVLARGASIASSGALIRDRTDGRVMPSLLAAATRVTYALTEEDRLRAIRGGLRAAELWLEGASAEWVVPTVWGAPLCRTMDDVRRVLHADLPAARLSLYASHPQASCAIGRACDADGALLGSSGLYVADASALPSNVGRNPQISVMTVARRTASRLATRLGGRVVPLTPA
jgi:choline dehydrogenase-like flavoprotein